MTSNQEVEPKTEQYISRLRNPYIIIVGISQYEPKAGPCLYAVPKDVDMLYDVFKNEYNYHHVYANLDSLKYDNQEFRATKKNFSRFLKYHCQKIEELKDVDSFVFAYSGHGVEDMILLSNGEKMLIPQMQQKFDNETLDILQGKPKIFVFDCCRGQCQEGVSKSIGNKQVFLESEDMITWYGSASGYKSFERADKNGSVFTCAIAETFHRCSIEERYSQWDINEFGRMVLRNVKSNENCRQTPHTDVAVVYKIFFEKGTVVKQSESDDLDDEKSGEQLITTSCNPVQENMVKKEVRKDVKKTEVQKQTGQEKEPHDIHDKKDSDKKLIINGTSLLVMMMETKKFVAEENELVHKNIKKNRSIRNKNAAIAVATFAGTALSIASGGTFGLVLGGAYGLLTGVGVSRAKDCDDVVDKDLELFNEYEKILKIMTQTIQYYQEHIKILGFTSTDLANPEKFNKKIVDKKYHFLKQLYQNDKKKSEDVDRVYELLVKELDDTKIKVKDVIEFHSQLKKRSDERKRIKKELKKKYKNKSKNKSKNVSNKNIPNNITLDQASKLLRPNVQTYNKS